MHWTLMWCRFCLEQKPLPFHSLCSPVFLIEVYIEKSLRFSATSCCRHRASERASEWVNGAFHSHMAATTDFVPDCLSIPQLSAKNRGRKIERAPRPHLALFKGESVFLSQNSTAAQGCCSSHRLCLSTAARLIFVVMCLANSCSVLDF
jgi:hypothetical protein